MEDVIDVEGDLRWDDATWILTNAFMMLSMKTGYALMESGYVHRKNEISQMVLNIVDISFFGITYWMVGHGFIYGSDVGTNPFIGIGSFFFATTKETDSGRAFSTYTYELSLAALSTTLVSGAVAERVKISAWCLYCVASTFIYVIPAGWIWGQHGWLRKLGAIDVAGGSVVHGLGSVTALVFARMLGKRQSIDASRESMPGPANAMVGFYMVLWGYFGMHCGSTFGIRGERWKLTARASATTTTAIIVGFTTGLVASYIKTRSLTGRPKYHLLEIIQATLGSVVSVTAGCTLISPRPAAFVGVVGAILAIFSSIGLRKLGFDDVTSVSATHGVPGLWGVMANAFFAQTEQIGFRVTSRMRGVFYGGSASFIYIQGILVLSVVGWALLTSFLVLTMIDKAFGLRIPPSTEEEGIDCVLHDIHEQESDWTFRPSDYGLDPLPGTTSIGSDEVDQDRAPMGLEEPTVDDKKRGQRRRALIDFGRSSSERSITSISALIPHRDETRRLTIASSTKLGIDFISRLGKSKQPEHSGK